MSKNFYETGKLICGLKEKRDQPPVPVSRKIKGFCSHIGTLLSPSTPLLSLPEHREEAEKNPFWLAERLSDMTENYILELCAHRGLHKLNGRLANRLKCQLNEVLNNTPDLREAFRKINEPSFSIGGLFVQNNGLPTRKYIIKGKGTLILILRNCRVSDDQNEYNDDVLQCVREHYASSTHTCILNEEALQSILGKLPQILKIHFKEICIISCDKKSLQTSHELIREYGVLSCDSARYAVQRKSRVSL